MSALGDFLAEAGQRRREPGTWDCATFPAEWAMRNSYADPLAPWRGYDTDDEADGIICRAGGLVPLFTDALAGIGAPVTAPPFEAGDIGVVTLLGNEAGAIYTGVRWALVTDKGIGFITLGDDDVARAWRLARDG